MRDELERGVARAWEGLTEGWRELLTRSNAALTQFVRPANQESSDGASRAFPQWGLLAGEAWETAHAVIVRLELPGLTKEDIDVSIDRGALRVRGNKRFPGGRDGRTYHLMERAFGSFERTITLPHNIQTTNAELCYQDGVLTAIISKTEPTPPTPLSLT